MANLPNGKEAPAPTFIEMEKPDEKTPPKQAVIPHPMVLGNPPQTINHQKNCVDGDHKALYVCSLSQT